jgi:hypothetical protein
MLRAHWGVRTSRPQGRINPEFPRSQCLAFALVITALLTAGCPLGDSALLDTIAGDPLVGRAPADEWSGTGLWRSRRPSMPVK